MARTAHSPILNQRYHHQKPTLTLQSQTRLKRALPQAYRQATVAGENTDSIQTLRRMVRVVSGLDGAVDTLDRQVEGRETWENDVEEAGAGEAGSSRISALCFVS